MFIELDPEIQKLLHINANAFMLISTITFIRIHSLVMTTGLINSIMAHCHQSHSHLSAVHFLVNLF